MEPGFQRGDILFLNMPWRKCGVGDVVVFKMKDRDVPIAHHILRVHTKPDNTIELLTKSDHNLVDDRDLYAPGQLWLQREDILGKVVGTLRFVGLIAIALYGYPALKYMLWGRGVFGDGHHCSYCLSYVEHASVGMMGIFIFTS